MSNNLLPQLAALRDTDASAPSSTAPSVHNSVNEKDIEKSDSLADRVHSQHDLREMEALEKMGLVEGEHGQVKRGLKQRHMSMIALGGTIGTGLFIGLGQSLREAGPLSCLLGYSIIGFCVWALMTALGEVATFLPVPGGFIAHASRFVSEGMGASLALTYWYSYGVCIPVEILATAIIIQFWDVNQVVHPAIWISIILVVVTAINILPVRWYGEIEAWMATIKVATVVILIFVMLSIDLGAGPDNAFIGGKHWRTPGHMAQYGWELGADLLPTGGISGPWGRFVGFWSVLVSASFAYAGTEIIGVCVGEVENPARNVPRAINRVALRIGVFFVASVLLVGLVVPYTDSRLLSDASDASASPFVIAIESAGIKVLPSIINAVLITVTISAAQADLFACSRTMYALALDGNAPKVFRKCNKQGVPIAAVGISALFGPLAYMGIGGSGAASKAFGYLYELSAVSILAAWVIILLTYIRFYHGMKAQGLSRDTLVYRSPLQPYLSYFVLCFFCLVILGSAFSVFMHNSWDTAVFLTNYLPIPFLLVAYVGFSWKTGSWLVRLDQMDFETGKRELEQAETPKVSLKNESWWVRALDCIF